MDPLLPGKADALAALFPARKPIIGVVHLPALPGAPRYNGGPVRDIYAAGARDALALARGGVDGIIIENGGDWPYSRPEDIGPATVAGLTAASCAIRDVVDIPLGVICVANAALPALAVAKAIGAAFVRVNQWANAYVSNEGLLSGDAANALRFRAAIGGQDIKILADVHVKFGAHAITADRSIGEQARDAEWLDADILIASGQRTGDPTPVGEVQEVKAGTSLPVIVGSGVSPEQIPALFAAADGAIVGQWLKIDGHWWNPVDQARVERLMAEVAKLR